MLKDGYFTCIIQCLVVLHAHVHAPVFATTGQVFQMSKCSNVEDPSWTFLARLTASNSLECARACYANNTCDHVSFYEGTCMLWQGEAACGSSHVFLDGVRCKDGWYGYEGSCYLPVAQTKTWADSVTHCESLGANLMSIRSLEEEAFAVDLVSSLYPGWDRIWIGASDLSVDGVWEWVSGEAWGFANWMEGEPNGFFLGTPEHCGEMRMKEIGKGWNDVRCDDLFFNFVCEKNVL